MSTINESGHAKNLANFQALIISCMGYNGRYNPSNGNLTIKSLQDLYQLGVDALNAAHQAKTVFDNVTNNRKQAFAGLTALTLKITNALMASGTTADVVADAKVITRKILGRRAKAVETKAAAATNGTEPAPPASPAVPTPKSISVSQLSFDNKADHLNKLVILLAEQPEYAPNETELQIPALRTMAGGLKEANQQVVAKFVDWNNARIERDRVMYNTTDGMVQVAKEVKIYVKSLYGNNSPQYQQIIGLQFKAVKI
ncbi:MAG: hypothetical protein JST86_03280 [Bacteroidetes bacterium]|nr:hypothetical protein [Bacteroidota bacterium]